MSGEGPLSVVLVREGPLWLAQLLEHDIGAQGDDLRDVVARLTRLLEIEGEAVMTLPPAPPYFHALWPLAAGAFEPAADAVRSGRPLAWRIAA